MELLAPAGNLDKLRYAYHYGADAAYIGLHGFSLRTRADNFSHDDFAELRQLKADRRLYCALNIYFRDADLYRLEETVDRIEDDVFDAFIISDIGVVPMIRRRFPGVELHLSTQANCVNGEAAKLYRDMGFSRIVPGRELSLVELAAIKNAVPDLELEVFVHGAMCIAYSGRCFLSAWMADRSANRGDCAHSCRWTYRVGHDPLVLEEKERPDEHYPIVESDGFTEILSSRDLNMIEHLPALRDAGIDSLKIEGRMKSVYYTAVVTRAYRKALDAIEADRSATSLPEAVRMFTAELEEVSHRDYTTGFYFDHSDIQRPARSGYRRGYLYIGSVEDEVSPGRYLLTVKNGFGRDEPIEFLGPDTPALCDDRFRLFDADGEPVDRVIHHGRWFLETDQPVAPRFLVRKRVISPTTENEQV